MPFENEAEAEERRKQKAEKAREAFARQQAAMKAAEELLMFALTAQYVRGYDELGALLRVSARAAQEITKRPGFPRPRNPAGDRISLWKTSEVIAWIDADALKSAE